MTPKEKAPGSTGAKFEANYISIVADFSKLIKKRLSRISTSFWRLNYALEEDRQDHAARGHLWRQIVYCFALLVFRLAGKVVR